MCSGASRGRRLRRPRRHPPRPPGCRVRAAAAPAPPPAAAFDPVRRVMTAPRRAPAADPGTARWQQPGAGAAAAHPANGRQSSRRLDRLGAAARFRRYRPAHPGARQPDPDRMPDQGDSAVDARSRSRRRIPATGGAPCSCSRSRATPEARSSVVESREAGIGAGAHCRGPRAGPVRGSRRRAELLQVYRIGTPRGEAARWSRRSASAPTTLALLHIAQSETDPAVRDSAILTLGSTGARDDLRRLYVRLPRDEAPRLPRGAFAAAGRGRADPDREPRPTAIRAMRARCSAGASGCATLATPKALAISDRERKRNERLTRLRYSRSVMDVQPPADESAAGRAPHRADARRDHARHLRRVGRSHAPQAAAGALSARRGASGCPRASGHRRRAVGVERRELPPAVPRQSPGVRRAADAGRGRVRWSSRTCSTSSGELDDPALYRQLGRKLARRSRRPTACCSTSRSRRRSTAPSSSSLSAAGLVAPRDDRGLAPHDRREAVRDGPGERARRSTPRCTRTSTRRRSSASITTSARKPCRTCWCSASPTACSSRSGTAATSTTCRSPRPRRSASSGARPTTRGPARCATWCRTT